METLTIKRKTTTTQSVAITLPYYAFSPSHNKHFAIVGEENNMCVTTSEYGKWASVADFADSQSLPEDAHQISEAAFVAAYEKAQLMITDKFLASCPSVSAPQVAA